MAELAHFTTDLSARARAATHNQTTATAAELHTHLARTDTAMQRSLVRQTAEIGAVRHQVGTMASLLARRPECPYEAPAMASEQAQLQEAEDRHRARAREAHIRRVHEL
jgi:hypothetical protein